MEHIEVMIQREMGHDGMDEYTGRASQLRVGPNIEDLDRTRFYENQGVGANFGLHGKSY